MDDYIIDNGHFSHKNPPVEPQLVYASVSVQTVY